MSSMLNILSDRRLIKETLSRCPTCLAEVRAQVYEDRGRIVMAKRCDTHGAFEVTLAADPRYYYHSRGNASSDGGCCGSACGCHTEPAHGAADVDPFEVLSTCIALIEIVDSCNLTCPTCFASSPWGIGDEVDCITFEQFVSRVQNVLDRKGMIDVLQLSGGEPTIHPQFFDLLDWALHRDDIGYVLINTNAVRVARDHAFLHRLGESRARHGKFELYVQFDGTQEHGQMELRGADLRAIRQQAIDAAGALGIPTTLAVVVTPTTIAHLGDTLRFGLQRRHCRGITFQPMFTSGRIPSVVSNLPLSRHAPTPISVGDVIAAVTEQSRGLLRAEDFTPLPCGDPNCHTIGYLLRTKQGTVGLSSLLDLSSLQGFLRDRVNYNLEDMAQCGCETEPLGELLKQYEIGPDQPFRLFIKPFMDAWTFDQDRIDRCCTHVIRPDGKLDSFCRYYLNGGALAYKTASANGS